MKHKEIFNFRCAKNFIKFFCISKATFGIGIDEHKEIKNISDKSKINLRDHMTDLELIFTMLEEKATTEITNFNVKKNDLNNEKPITVEHVKNNKEIRELLKKNNIVPEDLPVEEDLKKLEKRIKQEQNKLI